MPLNLEVFEYLVPMPPSPLIFTVLTVFGSHSLVVVKSLKYLKSSSADFFELSDAVKRISPILENISVYLVVLQGSVCFKRGS